MITEKANWERRDSNWGGGGAERGRLKTRKGNSHTPPSCLEGDTGSQLPGALLPKPQRGSRFNVTCTISRSSSAVKLFLLFCEPRNQNRAPHCAFPPNHLRLNTTGEESTSYMCSDMCVCTHTCTHIHTQYWDCITEHTSEELTGSAGDRTG